MMYRELLSFSLKTKLLFGFLFVAFSYTQAQTDSSSTVNKTVINTDSSATSTNLTEKKDSTIATTIAKDTTNKALQQTATIDSSSAASKQTETKDTTALTQTPIVQKDTTNSTATNSLETKDTTALTTAPIVQKDTTNSIVTKPLETKDTTALKAVSKDTTTLIATKPVAPKPPTSFAKKTLVAEFIFKEVEYDEVAAISNVLKITNYTGKSSTFTVSLSFPSGWKTLNNSKKEYTLSPEDSIFIPVRLVTNNKVAKGGIKYNISAFISNSDGRTINASNFFAGHPKISNWQMHVLPKSRIYFLNNEDAAPFDISFENYGDEKEDIILSMNKIGRDFMVTDTTGKFFKKNYVELSLPPFSDTTIPFVVQVQKPQRNFRRIDNFNYLPNSGEGEKHYGLFLKANEITIRGAKGGSRGKKVDFIKLANSIDFVKLNNVTQANQYGSNVIPLTMIVNFNNILGQQPIMNSAFYGNTALSKKSFLSYSLLSSLSYYRLNNQTISNLAGIINYDHEKFFISMGNGVGLNYGNLRGIGRGNGISGGYKINKHHAVGAYFLRNNRINRGIRPAEFKSYSAGVGYSLTYNKLRLGIGYDRTSFLDTSVSRPYIINSNKFSNTISGNVFYQINRRNNIGIMGQTGTLYNSPVKTNIHFLSLIYGVNYLQGRGATTINTSYREGISNSTISGLIADYNNNDFKFNHTSAYRTKDGKEFRLTNNYNEFNFPGDTTSKNDLNNPLRLPRVINGNIILNNIFTIALPTKSKVSYIPGVYSNYSYLFSEELTSTGLQLSINTFNPQDNFRLGYFIRGGYNKLLKTPSLGWFFTAQTNAFASYRTWNFIVRYAYGPQGISNVANTIYSQFIYPQIFSGTIGNQYQFKNKHFVLENNFNYSYLNVNKRHNISIFTQFFYFSNDGWRFSLNTTYNHNISENFKQSAGANLSNNYALESANKKIKSRAFQLGLSIKKDFSIPIPKFLRKTRYCTANFKAFLDLNGNKKFDTDEILLENVVIRMNDFEVLTNDKGEASFLNMGLAKYKLQVMPLTEIGAWFPVVPDSMDVCGDDVMFIPFSRGVQILGNVQLDREKFSSGIVEKIDISRIKIFLIDSLGKTTTSVTDSKGNFLFYVHYGKYTLKFDEKVLGTNFELTQNDIYLELFDGMDSYYHTFFIVEKKRKVKNKKFDANGNVIDETEKQAESVNKDKNQQKQDNKTNTTQDNKTSRPNNETSSNEPIDKDQLEYMIDLLLGKVKPKTTVTNTDLAKIEAAKIEKRDITKFGDKPVYIIQVGAYRNGLPRNVLVTILRMNISIGSYTDPKDQLTKYFTGNYATFEEAVSTRNEIMQRGLKGAFIMVIDKGKIISVTEFNKQKNK